MKQELMWEQPLDMEVEAAGRRPELRGAPEKRASNRNEGVWETGQLSFSRMMKAG